MIRKYLLALAVIATPLLFASAPVFAVDVVGPGVCDRYENVKDKPTVCADSNIKDDDGKTQNPIYGSNGILTKAINILSIVVSIVAIISISLAGLKYITSGNNPQEVGKAREIILYACIGLVVAGLAQVLVRFVLQKVFFDT